MTWFLSWLHKDCVHTTQGTDATWGNRGNGTSPITVTYRSTPLDAKAIRAELLKFKRERGENLGLS